MCALYPFPWSREVFANFHEKHTRATAYVQNLFHLDEDRIVLWISENSSRWPRFKQAVKYVEKTYHYIERWGAENHYTCDKYYRRVINRKFLDACSIPVDTDSDSTENEEHTKETAVRQGVFPWADRRPSGG